MPVMKKYVLIVAAALFLCGNASLAQDNKANDKNKDTDEKEINKEKRKNDLNEYDEIIIKRKNTDKDAKVTIEIKDDKVIVDGKPIDDYVNDEISVQKRNINRYRLNAPSSPFRFEDGDWSMDVDMDHEGDVAFLGVTTEGSSGGVRILTVAENSAAAKARLKKDDVITKVNDKVISEWTEPEGWVPPKSFAGRQLNPAGGTIAIQGHDPGSEVHYRKIEIKPLP